MSKPTTVAEYAAALDQPLREIAEKLRAIVDAEFPQAERPGRDRRRTVHHLAARRP